MERKIHQRKINPRQQCGDAIKSVLALEKSNFIKEKKPVILQV